MDEFIAICQSVIRFTITDPYSCSCSNTMISSSQMMKPIALKSFHSKSSLINNFYELSDTDSGEEYLPIRSFSFDAIKNEAFELLDSDIQSDAQYKVNTPPCLSSFPTDSFINLLNFLVLHWQEFTSNDKDRIVGTLETVLSHLKDLACSFSIPLEGTSNDIIDSFTSCYDFFQCLATFTQHFISNH